MRHLRALREVELVVGAHDAVGLDVDANRGLVVLVGVPRGRRAEHREVPRDAHGLVGAEHALEEVE
ncbi:MAG: hypothetical protein CL844_03675 [Crocinitomicaceae bacterium]|nr:hypothetical protein [Crocinitomicaceae bacterium]